MAADGNVLQHLHAGVDDLLSGLAKWRVWMALAQENIDDQHRQTTLGPFWLLVNYLAFAGTFIFVVRVDTTANYAAYVAVGLFVWFYIMEVVNQATDLFAREQSFIKGTTLPLSVYVYRLAMQSIIRAGYAFIGCVGILVVSGTLPSVAAAWAIAGIAIIVLTTPAAILCFAFLGAFFPDSRFIVSNLTRVGMFLTPIFWFPSNAADVRNVLYHWNPFTYFLEIVRSPIVYSELPAMSFVACIGIALALWIVAVWLLGRLKHEVVFVL